MDNGECKCYDDEKRILVECEPLHVVLPELRNRSMCPAATPLPCMLCDPAEHTCMYSCTASQGDKCNTLELVTHFFDKAEETSQEMYLGMCSVCITLVVLGAIAHHSDNSYLQVRGRSIVASATHGVAAVVNTCFDMI